MKHDILSPVVLKYRESIHKYTYIHITQHKMFMHAYIHTYIHTYIHSYIHTHIHTYINTFSEGLSIECLCVKNGSDEEKLLKSLKGVTPSVREGLTLYISI